MQLPKYFGAALLSAVLLMPSFSGSEEIKTYAMKTPEWCKKPIDMDYGSWRYGSGVFLTCEMEDGIGTRIYIMTPSTIPTKYELIPDADILITNSIK